MRHAQSICRTRLAAQAAHYLVATLELCQPPGPRDHIPHARSLQRDTANAGTHVIAHQSVHHTTLHTRLSQYRTMGLKGSKPKLSKEDLDFLKKNTNFTEEQIKEWYKGFVVRSSSVSAVM